MAPAFLWSRRNKPEPVRFWHITTSLQTIYLGRGLLLIRPNDTHYTNAVNYFPDRNIWEIWTKYLYICFKNIKMALLSETFIRPSM